MYFSAKQLNAPVFFPKQDTITKDKNKKARKAARSDGKNRNSIFCQISEDH